MPLDNANLLEITTEDGKKATILPDGRLKVDDGEGGYILRQPGPRSTAPESEEEFYRNLAGDVLGGALSSIGERLLLGIQNDYQTRDDYINNSATAVDLLGLAVNSPKSGQSDSSAPLEGMSTLNSPLLLEAVLRGQANASGELLPSAGPVKVRNDRPVKPETPQERMADNQPQGPPPGAPPPAPGAAGPSPPVGAPPMGAAPPGAPPAPPAPAAPPAAPPSMDDIIQKLKEAMETPVDELAQALETDFNSYLTTTASEYYPDTKRMLFRVYLFGCEFKKVYNDPIRRRPVSESVQASDLIVDNSATDLKNAGRITHRIMMRRSTLIRMQLAGVYLRVPLTTPSEMPNAKDLAISEVEGKTAFAVDQEDQRHTIYECYCELNLPGFEHKDEIGETGLPLPYKVTIDKDSRKVLEVRRDWKQDDPNLERRQTFVKFSFVEGLGFYGLGLMNLLGNTTDGMTAIWRLLVDALMFGNFPGFIYNDVLGKQNTNIFRVPPGGGVGIQTGGRPISEMAMPIPYKSPDPTSIQLAQMIESTAQRLGGTADIAVGEGQQNAPVGTTLALIEQATKVVNGVHKGLHASQSEEFRLLVDRFREDPEAFWRSNRRPAKNWEKQEFLDALDSRDITPAADPNTPSHMHRIMKAVALAQLAMAAPPYFNLYNVLKLELQTLGYSKVQDLLQKPVPQPPQQQPPPDPTKMAELALKKQIADQDNASRLQEANLNAQSQTTEQRIRGQESAVESADRSADRASREKVAGMRLEGDLAKSHLNEPQPAAPAAAPAAPPKIPAGGEPPAPPFQWPRPI